MKTTKPRFALALVSAGVLALAIGVSGCNRHTDTDLVAAAKASLAAARG
jgi:hypothetical protein